MKKKVAVAISRAHIFLAIMAGVMLLAFGIQLIRQDYRDHLMSAQTDTAEDAKAAMRALESRIFAMELVANRLATYIAISPDIPDRLLKDAASALVERHPEIKSIALAPDLIVSHVAPLEGNEGVIGLDYGKVPSQLGSVARSYRDGAPVLAGPVQLVQGGRGYILRYPVFVPTETVVGQRFWGVISVVLSEQGLLGAETMEKHFDGTLNFALREVGDHGRTRNMLFGDPGLFQTDAIVENASFLKSRWELAAMPAGGWPTVSPNALKIAIAVIAAALVLGGMIFLIRRLALQIERSRSLLVHAVEALDEGFVLYDENDRLTLCNSRFAEYYKTDRNLLLGVRFKTLIRIAAKNGQFIEGVGREKDWVEERMEAHRNGTVLLEELDDGRTLKVAENRTPEGYIVGVHADITAQIKARQQAEEANRQKSEFLSNVTHELRTPLTVISGYAQLLGERSFFPQLSQLTDALSGKSPDIETARAAADDYATAIATQSNRIFGSAKHMLSMVNELLDWAEVERGHIHLVPESVSPAEITENALEELRAQAGAKGLDLIFDCTDTPVHADPQRLKQVLYNLVGNAIKFTEKGRITVRAETFEDATVFSVTDTGCGVADHDLERIFERFQQVDGSDHRAHGGFGLGLAITRQLVELHGGTISASSVLGRGSCFTFDIPNAPEETGEDTDLDSARAA
ncbi:ATP-binding protein [Pseudooceanicola sp. LIPI14-2-Ac024]|uniref:ATP-binding protein n=1 Tax=Pseudooceanicola sp. LIPI14-2-Ac024 TaxID=3344875 RepID=UPI0035CE899E